MPSDSLTIGNVEIRSLTDAEGKFPVTMDHLFPGVPLEAWEPYRQRYPESFATPTNWHVHYGSTLVHSSGQTVLVDTGIGPVPQDLLGGFVGTLPEDMSRRGIRPEEIDIVFITHAHIDHVGWNLTPDGQPTFPNARYLLHEADWQAMRALESAVVGFGAKPYVDRCLAPLESLGKLELLTGERAITAELTALVTPGHTPGSMSLLIASGGEQAIIPGDVLVTPAQVSEPDWVFGFDSDGAQAVATRRALLDRIEAEGMTLASCHFPHPGFGRVVRLEGRRYWQALAPAVAR